jgi:GDP-mannose 6-dehydrogenase
MGVDPFAVMELVCQDRQLNISPAYLRPGFAFGGSCLPKDLRAVVHRGRVEDVELPILEALLESNRKQVERAYKMVLATGSRRVGILGLAFKAGTDDLRESPMVTLIEMLLGKGLQLAIYDRNVSDAKLIGANREYIEREIPHIWTLIRPHVQDVIAASETVVIGNAYDEFVGLGSDLDGRLVVDLARAFGSKTSDHHYAGISW